MEDSSENKNKEILEVVPDTDVEEKKDEKELKETMVESPILEEKTFNEKKDETHPLLNYWNLLYLVDWLVGAAFLAGFGIGIGEFVHPNTWYLADGWMNSTIYSYPRIDPTFPTWSLFIVGSCETLIVLIVRLLMMIVDMIFAKKNKIHKLFDLLGDLHHFYLSVVIAMAICLVVTNSIKVLVGSPRPNYMELCNPDINGICQETKEDVFKRIRSFPSGHSSSSFTFLGAFSWYLIGKFGIFQKNGKSVIKLIIALLPMVLSMWIAISRIYEYWHRTIDVTAGILIGIASSLIGYFVYFPMFHKGGKPRDRYQSLKNKKGFWMILKELIKL